MKTPTLISLALCAVLLSVCKKGKDDPSISLLSRKARLAGKWQVVSGSVSITYEDTGIEKNDYYTFKGNDLTLNVTETSGPPTIYVGRYYLSLEIKKDGNFLFTETLGSSTMSAYGTWNFTSGVGAAKNKESITLSIASMTGDGTNKHLFNQFRTNFTYKLTELKNKELAMEASERINIFDNGDEDVYSSSYKFKAP